MWTIYDAKLYAKDLISCFSCMPQICFMSFRKEQDNQQKNVNIY